MRWALLLLVFLPLSLFVFVHRNAAAPTALGAHWAVVSAHPIASRMGADVLARGGNAVDAAVAIAFGLAVVLPEAGNIGGGLLAVGLDATTSTRWMMDGRERAPLAVTREIFLTLGPKASMRGPYAAGIPGSVAALAAMHQRYGRLPWSELVRPAAELAAAGYRLTPRAVRMLNFAKGVMADEPGARQQFYTPAPVTGGVIVQLALAETLRRIAGDPADFYRGETARLLVADAVRQGSPMRAEDLAAYEAKWRAPIACRYRGFELVSAGPPSSGGTILCETAQILAPFLLSALPMTGAVLVHLTAEAWRQSFLDRNLLGDPDFVTAPLKKLISPHYGEAIGNRILLAAPGLVPAPVAQPEPTETTHFSVVDRDGNAVALTTTLNGAFGNGHIVAGAGFLLNNEMDDFNTRPGAANLYGLLQGEPNSPGPGKRMLSSMSPTLVFHGDKLVLVIGTPGGSTIPTTVWQIIMRLIDGGWTLDRAVAMPRFHFQGTPNKMMIEPDALPPSEIRRLEQVGHPVEVRTRPSGDVQAIAWNTAQKKWMAVGDPRGDGLPIAK